MKRPIIFFVTALVALLSASSAGAVTVTVSSSYAGEPLNVGDTVSVVLTLDANETGIQLMGINVAHDNAVLQYNQAASLAATGTPTYILYVGGMMSSALYAQQDPWQTWQFPPAGQGQVNVNWADPSFAGSQITGSGIKLAELQFQVVALGDGIGEVDVFVDSAFGGILQINGAVVTLGITGSPVNVITPEPSTAILVGLGLLGLGVAGRRR